MCIITPFEKTTPAVFRPSPPLATRRPPEHSLFTPFFLLCFSCVHESARLVDGGCGYTCPMGLPTLAASKLAAAQPAEPSDQSGEEGDGRVGKANDAAGASGGAGGWGAAGRAKHPPRVGQRRHCWGDLGLRGLGWGCFGILRAAKL